MKYRFDIFIISFVAFVCCFQLTAQDGYRFDHGPYLQGLTSGEVYIYFTTSSEGFSRVELRKKGENGVRTFVTVDDGLVEAYNTKNAVRLDRLKPASEYEYRLLSKEMVEFRPYKVTYGEEIASPWFSFTTPDPSAKNCSFIAMSDIHADTAKYRKLLSLMPVASAESVFLIGDIISYFDVPDRPYTGFIDVSVDEFATEKPFVIVRGNHETRGKLARTYGDYVHRSGGHYYGTYMLGDTFIVMLDSGEDKADRHYVYAGITDFDSYRREQAEWLKGVVKTKEFRKAARRIVMVHIPPLLKSVEWGDKGDVAHGPREVDELFMPILNNAKIDLMICGHTHREFLVETNKGVNNFPIVVNDNRSASAVKCSSDGVHVRTVNTDGEVTLDRIF